MNSSSKRPGGRPQGEVRTAVRETLKKIGKGTTRELMQRACTGLLVTRKTLANMRTAGEVVVIETVRRPGVYRPVPVYALASTEARPRDAGATLQSVWGAAPAGTRNRVPTEATATSPRRLVHRGPASARPRVESQRDLF